MGGPQNSQLKSLAAGHRQALPSQGLQNQQVYIPFYFSPDKDTNNMSVGGSRPLSSITNLVPPKDDQVDVSKSTKQGQNEYLEKQGEKSHISNSTTAVKLAVIPAVPPSPLARLASPNPKSRLPGSVQIGGRVSAVAARFTGVSVNRRLSETAACQGVSEAPPVFVRSGSIVASLIGGSLSREVNISSRGRNIDKPMPPPITAASPAISKMDSMNDSLVTSSKGVLCVPSTLPPCGSAGSSTTDPSIDSKSGTGMVGISINFSTTGPSLSAEASSSAEKPAKGEVSDVIKKTIQLLSVVASATVTPNVLVTASVSEAPTVILAEDIPDVTNYEALALIELQNDESMIGGIIPNLYNEILIDSVKADKDTALSASKVDFETAETISHSVLIEDQKAPVERNVSDVIDDVAISLCSDLVNKYLSETIFDLVQNDIYGKYVGVANDAAVSNIEEDMNVMMHDGYDPKLKVDIVSEEVVLTSSQNISLSQQFDTPIFTSFSVPQSQIELTSTSPMRELINIEHTSTAPMREPINIELTSTGPMREPINIGPCDLPASEPPARLPQSSPPEVPHSAGGPISPSESRRLLLMRQDSFNRPDSPMFHQLMDLPKVSIIRRHRRRLDRQLQQQADQQLLRPRQRSRTDVEDSLSDTSSSSSEELRSIPKRSPLMIRRMATAEAAADAERRAAAIAAFDRRRPPSPRTSHFPPHQQRYAG